MFNDKKHKPRRIHFEIIPMIDVMMILVLFLSVMAFLPQVQSTLKPDVPKGADNQDEVTGDDVIVAMKQEPGTAAPTVMVNDTPVGDTELVDRIRSGLEGKPEARVVIAADKTLPYDAVIQMLIRLKRENIPNVVLATTKE